jgi:hypothetical protein
MSQFINKFTNLKTLINNHPELSDIEIVEISKG